MNKVTKDRVAIAVSLLVGVAIGFPISSWLNNYLTPPEEVKGNVIGAEKVMSGVMGADVKGILKIDKDGDGLTDDTLHFNLNGGKHSVSWSRLQEMLDQGILPEINYIRKWNGIEVDLAAVAKQR